MEDWTRELVIPLGLRRSLEESERAFTQTIQGLGLNRRRLAELAGRMRDSLGAIHRPRPRLGAQARSIYRGGRHV